MTKLEAMIFMALGEASVCWQNPGGAGAFDCSRCIGIGERLAADIERHFSVGANLVSKTSPKRMQCELCKNTYLSAGQMCAKCGRYGHDLMPCCINDKCEHQNEGACWWEGGPCRDVKIK